MTTTTVERQYHQTTSAYVLPNDAVEQDRLDAQAAAIVEMIGGFPVLAPHRVKLTPSKAVDVGCGTGVATVQLASIFPQATVWGLDLSAVPDAVRKLAPKNASFAQGNVLDVDYTRPPVDLMSREIITPGSLDFVFARMLFLGISNWPQYFQILSTAMRPGAIFEQQDLDWKFYRCGTDECLSDHWEWHKAIVAAAESTGLSTRAGSGAARLMEQAGMEIVSSDSFEFSFVPSTKTPNSMAMGRYVQAKLLPNYPELLRKMLGPQGVDGPELDRLIEQCLADITSEEGIHQKYTVTVARKL